MLARAGEVRGDRSSVVWKMAALAVASAVIALLAGHLTGMALHIGPLSSHMAQHIVVMNVMAPIAALVLLRTVRASSLFDLDGWLPESALVWAVVGQIGALWVWHIPSVFEVARSSPLLLVAMHVSLLAVALFFWVCVFRVRGNARWKPIAALLVTGKLFCLLGALLIFAPRPLYALPDVVTVSDQQLAGLLMIAACPLTYVVAGVVIAARWIADLEHDDGTVAVAAGASN